MIWGSGGSKSRLAKAAGEEPAGQMRDEKLHAVVARSTFPSQNVQNTPADHFWQLRCRKSARRCGTKHISKSKCTKHTMIGPLLEVEMSKKCTPLCRCGAKHISKSKCAKHISSGPLLAVEMSKKCTPLWREAHFQVKMLKAPGVRTTFGGRDVEKVHAVVARSTFRSQNVQNTRGSDHFLEVQMSLRFGSLHYTIHSTTLQYITLHYVPQHYNYNYTTTLHYTPLDSATTLHYTKLHYTTLHYTTLHYTTLHYLPLHFTTLHYTTLHYTTTTTTTTQLHSTTLRYTKLHYTTQHYTTLHYIPLHSTTLNYITLHYITLNDTKPQTDRQIDR